MRPNPFPTLVHLLGLLRAVLACRSPCRTAWGSYSATHLSLQCLGIWIHPDRQMSTQLPSPRWDVHSVSLWDRARTSPSSSPWSGGPSPLPGSPGSTSWVHNACSWGICLTFGVWGLQHNVCEDLRAQMSILSIVPELQSIWLGPLCPTPTPSPRLSLEDFPWCHFLVSPWS